jgi:hypothetical protein
VADIKTEAKRERVLMNEEEPLNPEDEEQPRIEGRTSSSR